MDTQTNDNLTIAHLPRRVTAANADELRGEMASLLTLQKEGAPHIAVDLRDVEFMDSSGLGFLVGSLKKARGRKGSVVLIAPRPAVRMLIELTRLHEIFPIVPDEQAAHSLLNAAA